MHRSFDGQNPGSMNSDEGGQRAAASILSSKPPNSTTSTRTPGSPTSSRDYRIIRQNASPTFCPGIGNCKTPRPKLHDPQSFQFTRGLHRMRTVVGQYGNCDCLERITFLNRHANAPKPLDMPYQKFTRSVGESDGEEDAAFDTGTTVSRHGGTSIISLRLAASRVGTACKRNPLPTYKSW
jgi:hypothetical protein